MTNETIHKTDVAIIGAGPVGLFAVFECGMLKMSCHVIDSLSEIGGQCTALYPEKPIYDIPGYPDIAAADLIENLEKQAAPFKPTYHMDQQVVSFSNKDSFLRLQTSANTSIDAKAVIVAGGAGCFGPNRPPLEGIEEYESRSVFYMVRRKSDFANKKIVIAGGGDSAVDWALSLAENAEKLYVVHRRDKFRAAPDNVEKLRKLHEEGKLELVVPAQLKSIEGNNGLISGVRVQNMNGEGRLLEADTLLPFYGLAAELGPIADWRLDLDRQQIVVDPSTCQSNTPKIYAIGDIASYSNKLRLILTGFAEAAQAAHDIYKIVYPDQALHFEYSTNKGVPGS